MGLQFNIFSDPLTTIADDPESFAALHSLLGRDSYVGARNSKSVDADKSLSLVVMPRRRVVTAPATGVIW